MKKEEQVAWPFIQVSEFTLERIIEELGKGTEIFAWNCVKPTDSFVVA